MQTKEGTIVPLTVVWPGLVAKQVGIREICHFLSKWDKAKNQELIHETIEGWSA